MVSIVRSTLIVLSLLVPASVPAQQFIGPYRSNAYGPGINSDATGRPFTWQPALGYNGADPVSRVRPDVYGPGVGMDQYGRPVEAAPYPNEPGSQNQGDFGAQQGHFGAIAFSRHSGAVGYSYDYSSGAAAEQSALNSCGGDCRVVVWFRNACGALAVGAGRGYGATWADTQSDAESLAINTCRANTTDCGVAQWVCTSKN
jgi:hypothetical protein